MIKYFLSDPKLEFKRATDGSAGYDVISAADDFFLPPRWKNIVTTGLYLAFPRGVAAKICSRSGLAVKHDIVVANAPGVVDSDYRGEVKVALRNVGSDSHSIRRGDRIAQILFEPVFPDCVPLFIPIQQSNMSSGVVMQIVESLTPRRVSCLEDLGVTPRGDGGFGSTGR